MGAIVRGGRRLPRRGYLCGALYVLGLRSLIMPAAALPSVRARQVAIAMALNGRYLDVARHGMLSRVSGNIQQHALARVADRTDATSDPRDLALN